MRSTPLLIAFLLCMILSFSVIVPVHSQPAQGDWVVTGEEVVENKTITLSGNLIVKSGGTLTLRGVTLIISSSYVGQYQISAEAGSSLYIYDSTIKPADDRYGPVLTITGAKFVMKQSKLQGSRGGEGREWFSLRETDSSIIENNTITIFGGTEELKSSIVLRDSTNAVIKNNMIGPEGKTDFDFILVNSHNTTVTGNNLVLNNFFVDTSWNCYIANNNIGLKRWSDDVAGLVLRWWGCGNNVIDNNTFSSMHEYGSVCTAFRLINTPFPNAFINNIIKGNVNKGGMGFKTCVLISQSSNAIVANNSFTEFPADVNAQNEAIQIYRSDNILVLNNYIDSINSGIILFVSSNNTLKGNRVVKSGRGIGLYYSSDNNAVENNTLENNLVNIIFDDAQNNIVRMNNFIAPERQGYDDGNNLWSRNYWSDYSGKDRGDGIGDVPYRISTKGMDNAPLVSRPLLTPVPVPTLKPASFEVPPEVRTELIQDDRILKDQVITLTGSISIEKGASLTLENVTLIAAPGKSMYMYRIYVAPGSSLYIHSSKIIGAEKGPAIKFDVEKGAKFTVKDSELYNLGDPYTQEGPGISLWDGVDGAVIENNVFVGCKHAIGVFPSSPNIRIVNNTISKCLFGITVLQGENITIMNNIISEVAHKGLWVEPGTSNSIVAGNKISEVWGYLGWEGLSNSLVENNTILNYMGGYPGKLGVEIPTSPEKPTSTPTPTPTPTPLPAPEISSWVVVAIVVAIVAVVVGAVYVLRKRK